MTSPVARPLAWLFSKIHRRELEMLEGWPGPMPIWPLGNVLQLLGGDLHLLFDEWRAKWGDIVVFWVLGQPTLLLNRPELLQSILIDDADEWLKNLPRAAARPIVGGSVIRSAGGQDWKAKRAAHPFEASWAERWYEAALPIVREVTRRRLQACTGKVDFHQELMQISFESFCRTLLGQALDQRAFVEHETMLDELGRRAARPIAISWSPTFWWRRRRWIKRLDALVAQAPRDNATDLLSYLMRHGGPQLGATQLRDEMTNMFIAGMRNVAICTGGVLYELSRSPAELEVVRAEVGAMFEANDQVEPQRLRDLDALSRAMDESMRLHTVVPATFREVKPQREVRLGDHTLPERTQVFLTIWTVHRHPELWPEPHRFDPSRFLNEPKPGTFFPFGMGERSCVGAQLALLFAKTIVATVLHEFELVLDPQTTFDTTQTSGTTPPRHGLPAVVRPRTEEKANMRAL